MLGSVFYFYLYIQSQQVSNGNRVILGQHYQIDWDEQCSRNEIYPRSTRRKQKRRETRDRVKNILFKVQYDWSTKKV
ncbi:hypothetical protein SERLADRAFT_365542 [Serpula lacrymans var. lacrymans S7.9]|uniref:Uncharacterized protein n=1 Tax=Serpula lacrymans var. lacrymans (strain S7.9) TaxID=578457 RepID=F8NJ58_SERL9|nr:uncharacterized protein SERLADRAFT_365542 [Serpula lacrymans var. lacrymans S7.9]EGO29542.1 hypothetical protein SERLADRAFT_365542 [Serpula lacrymans var. lacrymans S7.9]